MRRALVFASFAWWLGLVACAKPEDAVVAPVPQDASDAGDTGTPETIVDTAPVEAAECTPDKREDRGCGKCGKQHRDCSPSGFWSAWSGCIDEVVTADCAIGETREIKCGNCGTQKDTCDPERCTWVDGTCGGEGICTPGDIDRTVASCTVPGEVRERTCTDKCAWGSYGSCAVPTGWRAMEKVPTGFSGRYGHGSAWTGSAMLVWGGYKLDTKGFTSIPLADGASFDPAGGTAGTWTLLPAPPTALSSGRGDASVTFGKSYLIVWGGAEGSSPFFTLKNTGARLDTSSGTWSAITATSAPSARFRASATWSTTTNEMILWGGCTSIDGSGSCNGFAGDGAAYDPVADKWTALPAPPSGFAARGGQSMEWTGTEVIIWGGIGSSGTLKDGARYDPATKVWTTMPAPPGTIEPRVGHGTLWSGTELLIFGGASSAGVTLDTGARYTPGGSWTAFPLPTATVFSPTKRQAVQAFFDPKGKKLYVWSGADKGGTVKGGGIYDPSLDKWISSTSPIDEPVTRGAASVFFTGKDGIVWGGFTLSAGIPKTLDDGAFYRP